MVIHDWMIFFGYPHDKSGWSWFLHPHLEEGLQLFHQAHTSSAVAGDVDAGQAADAGELRGLLEELILVSSEVLPVYRWNPYERMGKSKAPLL